jgi:Ca-activated chloride channel family protein
MDFASPKWLNLLYVLPLLVLMLVYGARRRARELEVFTGPSLGEPLAPGRSWRKSLLKSVLRIGGFVLLVLALARPQFGSQLVKVEREGIDLVIALDTSLSMLAEDMKPNRLERAKHEIIDLIEGLKGDRVGIVAFAGEAFILCPLTVDYDAALMFTQTADVDLVSKPGTAIDKAIGTATSMFPESRRSDRVIILVTDGEAHDGDPVAAAHKAADAGIRIYTIGIGNPAGELIPLRGTDGAVSEYKKDKAGETVMTRLDEETLRQVAHASDGEYLPATREGLELKVLYREIAGMERKKIEGEFMERKTDRFGWFLALSFLLLGLEGIVTRRGTATGRPLHTGAASIAALLVLVAVAGPAAAGGIDRERVKAGNQYFDSGEYEKALSLYREAMGDSTKLPDGMEWLLYNQGNALFMMGNYPDALGKYHQSFSSEDSLQAGQMLYNRGNTLMQMGKPQEAVESYLQALRYLPDDADARHNLELALRLLEEEQQQQQQQQQQDQDQQQDDEQQQDQQQQDQQQQNQQQEQQDNEQQQQDQDQQQQNQQEQPDSSQAQPQEPDSSQGPPPEQPPPQTIELSKEDALRILKLLEEQEKELQKRKRKAAFKRVRTGGKDW